jgi:hypothetical protein
MALFIVVAGAIILVGVGEDCLLVFVGAKDGVDDMEAAALLFLFDFRARSIFVPISSR